MEFGVSDGDAFAVGLACGGTVRVLVEPIGAATLVWLIFEEVPPLTALLGGPLVIAAVGFQILIRARAGELDAGSDKPLGPPNV